MGSNIKIVIYGKPNCAQCEWTTKRLTKAGWTFDYLDVTKDKDADRDVRKMGFGQLPVVVVSSTNGNQIWSGFRDDMIKSLGKAEVKDE